MKINILGDGSFGGFLKKELPNYGFELDDKAKSIILAIPFSAYESAASELTWQHDIHLINVCSVQEPSTNILLKYTDRVTSIHPLFGARTPVDKRHSILTHEYTSLASSAINDERAFLLLFRKFSDFSHMMKDDHDKLMLKTHVAAVMAAKQLKHYVDDTKEIPDKLIPNSFRLLKQFVQTLEDMPSGTIESIMANSYI